MGWDGSVVMGFGEDGGGGEVWMVLKRREGWGYTLYGFIRERCCTWTSIIRFRVYLG